MIKIVNISILLIMIILLSCEKQGLIVKCKDCTKEEPLKTSLELRLSMNDSWFPNKIKVYEGNLENNVACDSLSTMWATTTISVMINKKYTITATYIIDGITYVVVDSVTPRVRFDKEQCEEPCYFVYDRKVDLRYKY